MKFLGILVALAIIYLVVAQMGSSNTGLKSSIASAEQEAEKVNPSTPTPVKTVTVPAPPAAAPQGGSIRRPIDRAREVSGMVKQRNGNGEF